MKKLSVICCCTFLFFSYSVYAQYPYTDIIVEGQTITTGSLQFTYFPSGIISPGNPAAPEEISSDGQVEFESAREITLKDGFMAGDFNNNANAEFWAHIDNPMDVVIITPDASHISSTDGLLHVNKWEKLEIGITLPQVYQTAIDNFFDHYYAHPSLYDPLTDLNPYASDSLEVRIDLVKPDNTTITKWAFYMKEAEWYDWNNSGIAEQNLLQVASSANPLSPYNFRFRFAPDQENTTVPWQFSITVNIPNTNALAACPLPQCSVGGFKFICDEPLSDNYGYLHVNPNNKRYLQFEKNDKPFFGMGHVIAGHAHGGWLNPYVMYKRDLKNYTDAIEQIHNSGGNFAGMDFEIRDFAPEHEHLGVYDAYSMGEPTCPSTFGGVYGPSCLSTNVCCLTDLPGGNRQMQCWMFDKVLDKLREQNVYIDLAIQFIPPIGDYQEPIWGNDAYVKAYMYPYGNATTPPYFGDINNYFLAPATANLEGALYYWKRRYKYIIDRWGFSPNIAMLLTFDEVDQTLGYHGLTVPQSNTLCCPFDNSGNISVPADQDLLTTIDDWHKAIIPYVENTLGDNNHLWSISLTAWGFLVNYQTVPYHSILDDVDIADMHDYDDEIDMNNQRYSFDDFIHSPSKLNLDKPFHFGETSSFGTIDLTPNNPNDNAFAATSYYYNNLDISFHNMIWATAMQGGCTTGLDWQWYVLHRWKNANPVNIGGNPIACEEGDAFDCYDAGIPPSIVFSDKIKNLTYNYTRLSDFVASIDFNESYVPLRNYEVAYGYESYYLTNGSKAYGWLHNINFYWANKYYYSPDLFNWGGCTSPSIPSAGVKIEGLQANWDYYVTYFNTRLDNPATGFPSATNYHYTSNSVGEIYITDCNSFLGCDSNNADIAFSVIPGLPQGQKTFNQIKPPQSDFGFTVFPNPSNGIFHVELKGIDSNDSGKTIIKVYDLTGRKIKTFINKATSLIIDLADLTKGCYFIGIERNYNRKFKRIALQ